MNISQLELKNYYKDKRTMIFFYRKVFQINYNSNTNSYILREIDRLRIYKGIGYTRRGRYIALDEEMSNKILSLV